MTCWSCRTCWHAPPLTATSRACYSEREVNDLLNAWHLFGNHCALRRALINMRLLQRKPDAEAMAWLRARSPKPRRRPLVN
jgi:hypothetical protein